MIGILWLFLQSAASHLLYLALRLETGSFPKPLSAKEEQAAFAAMRAGDAAARETLICHNLRLVAHIVKKYYTVSGGQDDFISIGTIGLIKAVDTYDCARTTRFASYASRCIENELRMQLRHTRREAGTVSLQEPLETSADSGMLTLADVLPDLATMEEDCELRDAAAQLNFLGYDAIAVSDPVVMSVYTRRFSTRDVFIGISRSGRTKLLIDGLKEASAGGAYCAIFSNYVNSPAAAIADAFFCTSRIDDMKSVVGQESNLSMLAAIGALVMVVARLTDRDAL